MGSSRFPGKMLAKLGPFTIIEWVLMRVKKANMLDEVLLATSDLPRDDVLVNIADQCNVSVYRGSESDVLKRFANAATKTKAETVIRVCADNPFIDPDEINRLVTFFESKDCDYACNHQNRLDSNYADGFGAEIFSFNILQKVNFLAKDSRHREHITLYLWENKNSFIMMSVPAPVHLRYPQLRFDINTNKDKEILETLIDNGITLETKAHQIITTYLSSQNELG
jgi:spore coat polysaccharide biosynthesis protein SpsF